MLIIDDEIHAMEPFFTHPEYPVIGAHAFTNTDFVEKMKVVFEVKHTDSLAGKLDELDAQIAELRGGNALFAGAALPQLERLVQQAKMLSSDYHVVTTNPPYVGGKGQNKTLKDFLKEE